MKALEAAKERAVKMGYNTVILGSTFKGEAREVARSFSSMVKGCKIDGEPVTGPACLLAGGETTVTIRGRGKGGRNQEFALACATEIQGQNGIVILSGGTDGNDGPTEVAGAVADGSTCERARELGMDPSDFLNRNDSYTFFSRLGDHVVTGPTRTNVMDIMLGLVEGR
jgi:hydroxypyruvate reductase